MCVIQAMAEIIYHANRSKLRVASHPKVYLEKSRVPTNLRDMVDSRFTMEALGRTLFVDDEDPCSNGDVKLELQ